MRGIEEEKRVIRVMVELYCRAHHNSEGVVCDECKSLIDYAHHRLERCSFGAQKPSCRKCTIHCYAPCKKEQIRQVMRFSGRRMILRHPIMVLRHLLKEIF